MFKSFAVAGAVFKAGPSLALLSPEGLPASHAGPDRGHSEHLLSSGGHWVQPDRMHFQGVQDEAGHLEAGPWVGRCGLVVLGSACQEGRVDVVPKAHGHHVEEALVQNDVVVGDGSVVVADPEDQ